MNIQNLFPTAVGNFNLGRNFTKAEKEFLYQQERRPNMGNYTSIDTQILDNVKVKKLRKFVEDSLNEYFQEVYKPEKGVGLRITQSWLNYTDKGQFHHKHSHSNSFLSGVLYVNADPLLDKIIFFKDIQKNIDIIPTDWNMWNSDSWWFPVETGSLIIFPSSLVHMVESVESEQTRISLSFNTYITGDIGSKDNLTHLKL